MTDGYLDITDLRVGNHVLYGDKICTVQSIMWGDVLELHILNIPGVQEEGTAEPLIDRVHPIPLSEEILLKCGFDANYESGFVAYKTDAKDAYGHAFDISLVEDNTNSTFNYVCWDINCGMKYVHELMNFYFAITGKELELKL